IDARRRGHLVPDLLRGQVHLSEPEQAADIALRTVLHLTALDEVRRIEVRAAPADAADRPATGPVRTWWEAAGRAWRVDVRREPLPDRPASCGTDPEPAFAWRCDDPVPAGH
ncbi:MAG TPA: hypothetical protein VFP72_20320, partial [Kineosporiaceae bacterium]|nr:hypothetical protein [Kineosporiaceae bacterium]